MDISMGKEQVEALMRRISGAVNDDNPPARPHMLAQYAELALRFGRLQDKNELTPGEFVRQKPGVGWFKKEGAEMALVLVRRLDPASPYDQMLLQDHVRVLSLPMTALKPDWVVASVTDSGDTLTYWLMPEVTLEPVSADETRV